MTSPIQSLHSRAMHPLLGIAFGLCATFVLLAFHAPTAHAGNCTFASTEATNSWQVAANWGTCNEVPSSTTPVIIPAATTTNLVADAAGTAGSITIYGTLKPWGSTLNVYGSWNNSGTFTAGTSTVNFLGTEEQIVRGSAVTTFNNVTLTKASGSLTSFNDMTIGGTLDTSGAGTLNIATSTLAITGTSTLGTGTTVTSTTGTLTFTGAVTNYGNLGSSSGNQLYSSDLITYYGAFDVGSGTATTTMLSAAGPVNCNSGTLVFGDGGFSDFGGAFNAGTGIVRIAGAGDYDVTGEAFNNLEVRKTAGTATFISFDSTVAGTLFLSGAGTLSAAERALSVTGVSTIGSGTTVTSTSGTLTFTDAVTNAGNIGTVSGNQLFSSSSTHMTDSIWNIGSGSATSTGNLANNGTINLNTGRLALVADYTGGGTFNAGTGTTVFSGTAAQSIKGSTYYNVEMRKASETVTIASSNMVIGGTLVTYGGGTLSAVTRELTVTGASTISTGSTVTSTSGTLTFTGAVTSAGSIGSISGNKLFSSTLANTGTLIIGSGHTTTTGAVTGAGTIKGDTGMLTVLANMTGFTTFTAGTGTVRLWGTATQSIDGATYYNFDMRKGSGTATFATAAPTIGGALTTNGGGTLSSAALNLRVTGASTIGTGSTVTSTSGTLTFTGAVTNTGSIGSVSGNKLFSSTLNNTGVLNVGSGYTTTTGRIIALGTVNGNTGNLVVMSALTGGGTFNKGTGTVTFAGSWQTVPSNYAYHHLAIRPSDTASVTTTGSISLGGGLIVGHSNATFNLTTSTFVVAGASTNVGTTTSTSGNMTFNALLTNTGSLGTGTGTILFAGVTNTGTVNLPTNSTSTGAVTLNGGNFRLNGHLMSVSNNWINGGGTLVPGTGTVRFYGVNQNIAGEGAFYNLTIQNTGTATLTGNVTSTGAFDAKTGSRFAVSTYRYRPAGASYTNNGLITIATGGKIVYALDSAKITDSAGTEVSSVTNPGLIFVKITDKDANLNGAALDTITARVTNNAASGADTEIMTLTETGNATGIFMNTTLFPLVSSGSITHDNGQFEISAAGTGSMGYTNLYDTTDTGTDTVTIALTGSAPGSGASTGGGGGGGGIPSAVTSFQSQVTDANKPINLANLASQGVAIHALVKLADDGDATTQEDSAVYYIGADGKRHAFTNSKSFFTWYADFSGVTVISKDKMASIPLGKNVIYKPGIKMVKFTTLNDTYLVTSGGILRWVKTEDVAKAYYGINWNQQIDDLSDAFFTNYTMGDPINAAADVDLAGVKASVLNISSALNL